MKMHRAKLKIDANLCEPLTNQKKYLNKIVKRIIILIKAGPRVFIWQISALGLGPKYKFYLVKKNIKPLSVYDKK